MNTILITNLLAFYVVFQTLKYYISYKPYFRFLISLFSKSSSKTKICLDCLNRSLFMPFER